MRFRRITKVATAALSVVIALNMGLFCIAHSSHSAARGKTAGDAPQLIKDDSVVWSGISEYAVCGDWLYILFDSKKVLNCYSLDGGYLHSYVFETRNNGQSHLYVKDGTLYLENREHFFYSFRDGMFADVHFPDISQVHAWREQLSHGQDIHQAANGDRFELRGASIWRLGESWQEKIVHRPLWLLIFQGNIQLYIFLACLILIWCFYYGCVKRQ